MLALQYVLLSYVMKSHPQTGEVNTFCTGEMNEIAWITAFKSTKYFNLQYCTNSLGYNSNLLLLLF